MVRTIATLALSAMVCLSSAEESSRVLSIVCDKPVRKSGLVPLPTAFDNASLISDSISMLGDVMTKVTISSRSPEKLQPKKATILTELRKGQAMLSGQTFYVNIHGHAKLDKNGKLALVAQDGTIAFRQIGAELVKSPARVVVFIEVCRNQKGSPTASEIFPSWTTRRIACIFSVKSNQETAFAEKGTSAFADAVALAFSPRVLPFEESGPRSDQSVTADRLTKRVERGLAPAGQTPEIQTTDAMRHENLFFVKAGASPGPSPYLNALVTYWNGDYSKAEGQILAALGQAPDDPKLLNLLGMTLTALKRYDEALPAYDRAVSWVGTDGVKRPRTEVIRAWPIILSNAAMAYMRMNIALGDAAPKDWKGECKKRMLAGIQAEGGRSAYSLSNYARFCDLVLKDVSLAEEAHTRAVTIGDENGTALQNAGSFFKQRFLASQDEAAKTKYLAKSVRCLNRAIAHPDQERQFAIATSTAIILWRYDEEIKARGLPNEVDYRRLIDEVVRQAWRPQERFEALEAFEALREKDYDAAVKTLTAKVDREEHVGDLDRDFDVLQLTAKVRAEVALARVRKSNQAQTLFAKRESLLPVVNSTAAVIRLANAAEAKGLPVPASADYKPKPASWAELRSHVYEDLSEVLREAMLAPDFSNEGFGASLDWKEVQKAAPGQKPEVQSNVRKATARGPDPARRIQ